jgi:hypothetical protein
LGESDFVLEVLAEANEKYNRYYKLKSLGYDLKSIEQEVGEPSVSEFMSQKID